MGNLWNASEHAIYLYNRNDYSGASTYLNNSGVNWKQLSGIEAQASRDLKIVGSSKGDSMNLGTGRSGYDFTGSYLIDMGEGPDGIHGLIKLASGDSIDLGAGDDSIYISHSTTMNPLSWMVVQAVIRLL